MDAPEWKVVLRDDSANTVKFEIFNLNTEDWLRPRAFGWGTNWENARAKAWQTLALMMTMRKGST